MLQETYYSTGKNDFNDDTFSSQEWSAPSMVDPDEIKTLIASFKLEGRKISSMRFIGLCYDHTREIIEEHAYSIQKQLDEEDLQNQPKYENIPPNLPFDRAVEIDEPLLIEFEDGDVFEIETPQDPEFRFSMNCIPWDIGAGINHPNLDANIIFAPCIDKKIIAVEVNTFVTDNDPIFHEYFDEEHSLRELVSDIVIRLEDGNGIKIYAWFDYCEIDLINEKQQILTLPFRELKPGLFNWEDLHVDPSTGFEPEGSTFFFGEIGEEHAEVPYMTLMPEKRDSRLYISVYDFLLFDWVITWFTKKFFDEYSAYTFSAIQWKTMLDEAEKLLRFDKFDDLFDYLTSLDKNHLFLSSLNYHGADFWKQKDKYKTQLKDMKKWTRCVLPDTGSIKICGF